MKDTNDIHGINNVFNLLVSQKTGSKVVEMVICFSVKIGSTPIVTST